MRPMSSIIYSKQETVRTITVGPETLQFKFAMQAATLAVLALQSNCAVLAERAERQINRLSLAVTHFSSGESWKTDLIKDGKDLVLQGAVKKRRIDADLVRAISCTAVENGLAASSGGYLRANPGLASRDYNIDMKWSCSYQAAMHLSLSRVQYMSWTWDGVRSGNPMVEKILSAVGDVEKQAFGWLIPVDRRVGELFASSRTTTVVDV